MLERLIEGSYPQVSGGWGGGWGSPRMLERLIEGSYPQVSGGWGGGGGGLHACWRG